MKSIYTILGLLMASSTYAYPNYPLGFFVGDEIEKRPLATKELSEFGFFSTDEPEELAFRFTLKDGYAFTKDGSTPGYAGYYGAGFGFGPDVEKMHLQLDQNQMITNHDLYMCDDPSNSDHSVLRYKLYGENCTKANIYLLINRV